LQRLLTIQAGLVLVAIIATLYFLGEVAISASLFGGAVAIANTILLSRRLESASSMAKDNPDGGVMTLYAGVVQRFIFVLAMFAIGMGLLKLAPLPLIGTFALAQLAYMICGTQQQTR